MHVDLHARLQKILQFTVKNNKLFALFIKKKDKTRLLLTLALFI